MTSPYTNKNVKSEKWQHKQRHKKFDYTVIVDWLGMFSWSNYSHPTGVVNRFKGPTFPLPATAVLSKGHTRWSEKGWCDKPTNLQFQSIMNTENLDALKCYKSTKVDRRTWLYMPSGTHWSTSSDTHQVVGIQKETSSKMYTPFMNPWKLQARPSQVPRWCFSTLSSVKEVSSACLAAQQTKSYYFAANIAHIL